jgi:hypothetical protein
VHWFGRRAVALRSMSTTADSDSDSEYIQIYEVDSEGNPIKDGSTGYKLTPEGREWDRKVRLIFSDFNAP